MKTILKGILLWLTVISITLFIIGGFESLVESNKYIIAGLWLFVNIALILGCHYNISYRELCKLTGYGYFWK